MTITKKNLLHIACIISNSFLSFTITAAISVRKSVNFHNYPSLVFISFHFLLEMKNPHQNVLFFSNFSFNFGRPIPGRVKWQKYNYQLFFLPSLSNNQISLSSFDFNNIIDIITIFSLLFWKYIIATITTLFFLSYFSNTIASFTFSLFLVISFSLLSLSFSSKIGQQHCQFRLSPHSIIKL